MYGHAKDYINRCRIMENLAELAARGFQPLKVFRTGKRDGDGHYGTAIFSRKNYPGLYIAPLFEKHIGEPVRIPAGAL